MRSDFSDPLNIGSEEMISLDGLAEMIMQVAGKRLSIDHVPGPLGVRGRRSDNRLIRAALGWEPTEPLVKGIAVTYAWIEKHALRFAAAA
jgi:nucleoside-diphosphate-sugar epimerase